MFNFKIGLEIHIQLKTKSKMFCRCSNEGELAPPNTTICPICLGHPGVLPVLNTQAVELGARMAVALNCTLPDHSKFDRKNYFYPDLPKGYQISQYDEPLGIQGYVDLEIPEGTGNRTNAHIRINRLHLEEDAAKLLHSKEMDASLVDFNRSSTPLAEIVTEPDFLSAAEAKLFLQELRLLARYVGASTADMEKGHLRCDANISINLEENGILVSSPISEIKNINSFRSVERALEYEGNRLYKEWQEGGEVRSRTNKITVGWDEHLNKTILQRSKEDAHDYRYFPEPDIPPLHFSEEDRERLRSSLPELPNNKRKRFCQEYTIPFMDSTLLIESQELADYFEQAVSELEGWLASLENTDPDTRPRAIKLLSNWLINKLPPLLEARGEAIESCTMSPENFAEFIVCLFEKKITSTTGQTLLEELLKKNESPLNLIKEKNLGQVSERGELEKICTDIISKNPDPVQNYKSGKTNALMFLVGQVMKEMKGRAQPDTVKELLERELTKK